MKRSIFKTAAVIAAFFLGVAINNSFGGDGDAYTTSSDIGSTGNPQADAVIAAVQTEYKKLINDLKKEHADKIAALESRLAALESAGGGGNQTVVDGMIVGSGGNIESKVKKVSSYYDNKLHATSEYTYDSYGRILKNICTYYDHLGRPTVKTNTHKYSNKKRIFSDRNGNITNIYEYY